MKALITQTRVRAREKEGEERGRGSKKERRAKGLERPIFFKEQKMM